MHCLSEIARIPTDQVQSMSHSGVRARPLEGLGFSVFLLKLEKGISNRSRRFAQLALEGCAIMQILAGFSKTILHASYAISGEADSEEPALKLVTGEPCIVGYCKTQQEPTRHEKLPPVIGTPTLQLDKRVKLLPVLHSCKRS